MKLSKRLRTALRLVLQRDLHHQYHEVLPDDIYIISYPKSGNTWLRFLAANLLYPSKSIDFLNIETLVPDIHKNEIRTLLSQPRPRILKSHSPLDVRYGKVVYIVRDPRDVVVSYYHYKIKKNSIAEDYSIVDFTRDFVAGELDEFGPWSWHAGGWFGARGESEDFLFFKYEELLDDPLPFASQLAVFLGVQADEGRLQEALDLSSADRMRNLERKQGDQWVTTRGSRADMPFVRKAASGAWRDELPKEAIEIIERFFGRVMRRFDYKPLHNR